MLAHPPHPGRERLQQQQLAEQLPGVRTHPIDGCPLVAPVEVAQEVAAVAPVEGQQGRRLLQRAGREAGPLTPVHPLGGEPGERLHHVGCDQRVLEVKGGHVSLGREDGSAAAVCPRRSRTGAAAGADPGVRHDRRQVHVLDIVGPVDGGGIEGERGLVGTVERLPQGPQAIDTEHRFGLGVGAVQLDVAQGPLDRVLALLHAGRQLRLPAPNGKLGDDSLHPAQNLRQALELALHAAPSRKRPFRHFDGLALPVVDRVISEPLAYQIDELAVAQRVPGPGRDLVHGRAVRVGALGGGGDDGGRHLIGGNDVDDPLRQAGELGQQTTPVGDDDGLGHAEATDPSGTGLGEGRLDDGRTHDRDGKVAARLEQGPLPQRLRVGVGVGPAEGAGACPSQLDEPVLHPVGAEAFGLLGQERDAGGTQLAAGRLVERLQALGPAALGVGVGASPTGGVDLTAPVDGGCERRVGQQRLQGVAPPGAGDVGRRHGDEVSARARFEQGLGDAHGPEEVDFDGGVQR